MKTKFFYINLWCFSFFKYSKILLFWKVTKKKKWTLEYSTKQSLLFDYKLDKVSIADGFFKNIVFYLGSTCGDLGDFESLISSKNIFDFESKFSDLGYNILTKSFVKNSDWA